MHYVLFKFIIIFYCSLLFSNLFSRIWILCWWNSSSFEVIQKSYQLFYLRMIWSAPLIGHLLANGFSNNLKLKCMANKTGTWDFPKNYFLMGFDWCPNKQMNIILQKNNFAVSWIVWVHFSSSAQLNLINCTCLSVRSSRGWWFGSVWATR